MDLCYPGAVYSDLWRADWKDFVSKLRKRLSSSTSTGSQAQILWRSKGGTQESSSVSAQPQELLDLKLQRINLYEGAEEDFSNWSRPTGHGSLPSRFPTPASLPAFSSVECCPSNLDLTPSASRKVTPYDYTSQAASAGVEIKINRLVMNPDPPPYDQADRSENFHAAYLHKPLSFFPLKPPDKKGLRELPRFNRESEEFEHRRPSPDMDPSHPDFNWDSIEGLYGVSYGPHGCELVSTGCCHNLLLSANCRSPPLSLLPPFRYTFEVAFYQKKNSPTLYLFQTNPKWITLLGGQSPQHFKIQTCTPPCPSRPRRSSQESGSWSAPRLVGIIMFQEDKFRSGLSSTTLAASQFRGEPHLLLSETIFHILIELMRRPQIRPCWVIPLPTIIT